MSSRLIYSYKGEGLLSLFLAPTKDGGFSMGFTDPAFKNVHFTAYKDPSDNRIHSHITDKSRRSKPYSQQIDVEFFDRLIRKMTKNWVVPVTEIGNIYIPTPELLTKIKEIIPALVDDKKILWPLESTFTAVKADLSNGKRWTRIPVDELPHMMDTFVLTSYKNSIHRVTPIPGDQGHVLCFTEMQHKRFINRLSRITGIDIFVNYLDSLDINTKHIGNRREASNGNHNVR